MRMKRVAWSFPFISPWLLICCVLKFAVPFKLAANQQPGSGGAGAGAAVHAFEKRRRWCAVAAGGRGRGRGRNALTGTARLELLGLGPGLRGPAAPP